jgi:branched-chain amino acid transport system permease protein
MQNNSFKQFWAERGTLVVVFGLLLILSGVGWLTMGREPFVRTALSGLTLGALYFMVAAGLTLIFGLMDVLNFAHGTMFMVGAYMGWQFFTNPTFLFGLAPLILALLTGLLTGTPLRPTVMAWSVPERWQKPLRTALAVVALVVGVVALNGLDFIGLADTALVATMVAANPLAEATPQEPLARFWLRPALLLVAGLLLAVAQAGPGDKTQMVHRSTARRGWIVVAVLAVLTVVAVFVREAAPIAVLHMNADWRFVLALLTGTLIGAGLGAVVELTLIRPLYVRPFYQVLVTLGLAYVLRELIMLFWKPLAYQMSRPPLFSQPGKAANLLAWFSGHNTTVDILGVTFPSYRLFIIVLGVVMLIALGILMNYSRLGMIIRAGVQDREMVEALGINVRRVFTIVFVLGAGLAALGGIGAAPFIPVQPAMGDAFQLQGFITVVIGGMGSYSGAAIGALLLGLARAFGDYLALKFQLSPAIAEASTVIIMAIVLLLRPAGLMGKKE